MHILNKASIFCTKFIGKKNSRKRRDVTTWRVAKRRYQGVENKPLICIAVLMGSNEKKTVIIKFPRFFARFPIVLEESHCLVFCQLNFY